MLSVAFNSSSLRPRHAQHATTVGAYNLASLNSPVLAQPPTAQPWNEPMAEGRPTLSPTSPRVSPRTVPASTDVTEQARDDALKPTLTLMQSTVCKVGDNSVNINGPETRGPLFETRAHDRPIGLQYMFCGNGLAPLFAVIDVPEGSKIKLGRSPHASVRLFAIKENARNRCDLVSDKIGVTAKRLSDDGRQAVIKLNFLRKGDFAHRLFYLDITLACENAEVELKSTLFKVATKPSRVILRNVPETWTRDDIVSHYPELGARGNSAEAPEVQMDDLGAHAARGAGAGTATGRRGRSAGGHSPPGVERRESVDESKSDAESVHSSTSSRHVIDSIISDLGEPRGVYLLNFRTSTLCVQFFTANYADLSSKGISAFLAPKRHYKIGRDLHHRSGVVVDSIHHGARSPRNQPFDGFTAEMINPPRAQHAEPASPAHVADAAAATPLPAAHIPQTSMYPQAHYAALLQGPLRHAMAPLQRALPYSLLMGAAQQQQQQQQQQLLWALTYPDLVEMARVYGLPGWPMPLPRMMPSARAAGLPITSVAHATTAAALSMPMSIRAPAARPPSASAGPIAGTPTSSFARSAFAVGMPASARLQSDATLAQLAAGRQLGGSPRPSTMGAGAGASRRVPKRGRSADDAPRARASKMSRTHGPSGPHSPSR